MSLTSVVAILAFILLALVAAIPLYERYKDYSKFKKFCITTSVILLFLIGGIDVWYRTQDPIALNKLLSRIEGSLNGLVNSSKKNESRKKDTIIKYQFIAAKKIPLHAFLKFSNISIIKTSKEDSLLISYVVINKGNCEAFNLKVYTMLVVSLNGKLMVLAKKTVMAYNSSVTVEFGEKHGREGGTYVNLSNLAIDSTYYCFKLDFNDSTKNRKSFTKILHITENRQFLDEIGIDLNNKIARFLVSEKYWKVPFGQ